MPTGTLGRRLTRRPHSAHRTISARIRALARAPDERLQFVLFCLIGGIGAVVNLAVYAGQVRLADVAPVIAATVAFCVAVTHNYLANRWLTFRRTRGGFVAQGSRFVAVSLLALAVNLALLVVLLDVMESVAAQALAICLVTPVNFLGNKLWSFAGGGA